MLSFCHLCEKQNEKWPQSRVIGAFHRDGMWITVLTLWRHPATPANGVRMKEKEVNASNFGNSVFFGVTEGVDGGDGGGAIPGAWDFTAAVYF